MKSDAGDNEGNCACAQEFWKIYLLNWHAVKEYHGVEENVCLDFNGLVHLNAWLKGKEFLLLYQKSLGAARDFSVQIIALNLSRPSRHRSFYLSGFAFSLPAAIPFILFSPYPLWAFLACAAGISALDLLVFAFYGRV